MVFSLLQAILTVLASFVVFTVLRLVVKPYFDVKYYVKQGALNRYAPIAGQFGKNAKAAITEGDCAAFDKKLIKENPNLKMYVTNAAERTVLVLADPKLLQDLFNKQHLFAKKGAMTGVDHLLKEDIILAEGNKWSKLKNNIYSIFNAEFFRAKVPLIVNITQRVLKEQEEKALVGVEVFHVNELIAEEILGKMFFGRDYDNYKFENEPLMRGLTKIFKDLQSLSFSPVRILIGSPLYEKTPAVIALKARIDRFKAVCQKIINNRRSQQRPDNLDLATKDLLDSLLEIQDSKTTSAYTDREFIDDLVSFDTSGASQISVLSSMMLYHLAHHPQYLQKAREEVTSKYLTKLTTLDSINDLTFLHLLMKETLRYTSPVNVLVGRIALQDCQLQDVHIKKGTIVSGNLTLSTWNPKYFPEPEKFNPDRWDTSDIPTAASGVYVPFSGEPRACVGKIVAELVPKIILCEFLSRFDYKVNEKYVHKMTIRFNYEPVFPMQFDLKKRY